MLYVGNRSASYLPVPGSFPLTTGKKMLKEIITKSKFSKVFDILNKSTKI